jgi:predicted GIY-YIG superfamily endonuclease
MFIYVIGNNDNKQKIGFAKNVHTRLKTLQTGNPDKLILHHYVKIPENRVRILEKKIHNELSYKRLTGEWFNMSAQEAKNFLDFAVIRWLEDNLI